MTEEIEANNLLINKLQDENHATGQEMEQLTEKYTQIQEQFQILKDDVEKAENRISEKDDELEKMAAKLTHEQEINAGSVAELKQFYTKKMSEMVDSENKKLDIGLGVLGKFCSKAMTFLFYHTLFSSTTRTYPKGLNTSIVLHKYDSIGS